MIHSGSRGLGHQVATDALVEMERAMARDGIHTNDRQLACARINSKVRPGVGVRAVCVCTCGGIVCLAFVFFCLNADPHKQTTNLIEQEGQDYLSAMAAAANFAWVNRSRSVYIVCSVIIFLK